MAINLRSIRLALRKKIVGLKMGGRKKRIGESKPREHTGGAIADPAIGGHPIMLEAEPGQIHHESIGTAFRAAQESGATAKKIANAYRKETRLYYLFEEKKYSGEELAMIIENAGLPRGKRNEADFLLFKRMVGA